MGWQTTFTLSRRAKGCHLVTNEVVSHIQDGLKDVKVLYMLRIYLLRFISTSKFLGGDVIPLHVQYF